MITVGCRADGFSGGFSGGVFNFSGIHKIKTIALFNGIPPFFGGWGRICVHLQNKNFTGIIYMQTFS